jgi:hypothetical protein
MASQDIRPRGALQSSAKISHEIRKVDKADPRTSPQVVMNLRNGCYARSSFFEGVPDVIRMRTARFVDGCLKARKDGAAAR